MVVMFVDDADAALYSKFCVCAHTNADHAWSYEG